MMKVTGNCVLSLGEEETFSGLNMSSSFGPHSLPPIICSALLQTAHPHSPRPPLPPADQYTPDRGGLSEL